MWLKGLPSKIPRSSDTEVTPGTKPTSLAGGAPAFPSHFTPKANYKFIDFCAKLKTTQSPLIHNNNLIQAKHQVCLGQAGAEVGRGVSLHPLPAGGATNIN